MRNAGPRRGGASLRSGHPHLSFVALREGPGRPIVKG